MGKIVLEEQKAAQAVKEKAGAANSVPALREAVQDNSDLILQIMNHLGHAIDGIDAVCGA